MKNTIRSAFLLLQAGILAASPAAWGMTQVQAVPTTLSPGIGSMGAAGSVTGNAAAPVNLQLNMQLGSLTPSLISPNGAALTPSIQAVGLQQAVPLPLKSVIPSAAQQQTPAAALAPAVRQTGNVRTAPVPSPAALPTSKEGTLEGGRLVQEANRKGLIPKLDFSAFSSERLSQGSAGNAHQAGAQLMDKVLGIKSIESSGDVVGAAASGRARKSKLAPAAKPKAKPEAPAKKKPYDPRNAPVSPWRLSMFQYRPEQYALTFLFGVTDAANTDKGYELLVGIAVHEAMEHAYKWVQSGRSPKDISLPEVLVEYENSWQRGLKEGGWQARDGWQAEEYKRRGVNYITRRFHTLSEDQGKVLSLEQTVLWNMTDPATGKSYQFKGKIDRLMLKGDTIYIRDWKTHFTPPSSNQLDRDDYQLGLYAMALRIAQPELVKGKKIKLVWDYKEFSQEIDADEAYLARIQDRVFSILRGIDTFSERVMAEKDEWQRRIKPEKNPKGLKEAKAAADALGAVRSKIDEAKAALAKLRKQYNRTEDGLTRYAKKAGLDSLSGSQYTLSVQANSKRDIPAKADDPDTYEAVGETLRKNGLWERFSELSYAEVKRMAELQGGSDHQAFLKIKGDLRSGLSNGIETEAAEDAAGSSGGGVSRTKLPRDEWAPDAEPGLLSPTQVASFMSDKDAYAKYYLLRSRTPGPKIMNFLAGSVVHETMEQVFIWMKGGRLIENITFKDVEKLFEERWKALSAEDDFVPQDGLTEADYKRGAMEYVKAKWEQMYPFKDQGEIVFLEKRTHFTLTDPETGKTYKFQGIPDRVMLQGDTVLIRDWKTHYKEPTDEEVKAHDYQLGLYILALQQLYPDLMKGRKAKLSWDFKSKSVVIDADDAYLANLRKRLFKTLREMDALREDVSKHREAWKEKLGALDLPKNAADASKRVDELGKLKEGQDKLAEGIEALEAEEQGYVSQLIEFSRRTGHVRVQGKTTVSSLRKSGYVSVPTKSKEREAYDRVVSALKAAGVWEKYSGMDLRALRKAMAEDPALAKLLEPYVRGIESVKVKLAPNAEQAGRSPAKKKTVRS
ncbi:MAG: PD-(D/E)XK nuclease family protein [Elusimicrobiota bacterium]